MAHEQKARYGGRQARIIHCPECGAEVRILDRQFVEYGPVRCGACGAEVQESLVRRLLQEAPIPGTPHPRSS